MKITVEHYNEKISIETKGDDITFEEFIEFTNRLASAIYNPKSIEDYLDN